MIENGETQLQEATKEEFLKFTRQRYFDERKMLRKSASTASLSTLTHTLYRARGRPRRTIPRNLSQPRVHPLEPRYPISIKAVCFEWDYHPGTIKWLEVVRSFSENRQDYPEWRDDISELIKDKLAEDFHEVFLHFKDSNSNCCISIHDGLWIPATNAEILDMNKQYFLQFRDNLQAEPTNTTMDDKPPSGDTPGGSQDGTNHDRSNARGGDRGGGHSFPSSDRTQNFGLPPTSAYNGERNCSTFHRTSDGSEITTGQGENSSHEKSDEDEDETSDCSTQCATPEGMTIHFGLKPSPTGDTTLSSVESVDQENFEKHTGDATDKLQQDRSDCPSSQNVRVDEQTKDGKCALSSSAEEFHSGIPQQLEEASLRQASMTINRLEADEMMSSSPEQPLSTALESTKKPTATIPPTAKASLAAFSAQTDDIVDAHNDCEACRDHPGSYDQAQIAPSETYAAENLTASSHVCIGQDESEKDRGDDVDKLHEDIVLNRKSIQPHTETVNTSSDDVSRDLHGEKIYPGNELADDNQAMINNLLKQARERGSADNVIDIVAWLNPDRIQERMMPVASETATANLLDLGILQRCESPVFDPCFSISASFQAAAREHSRSPLAAIEAIQANGLDGFSQDDEDTWEGAFAMLPHVDSLRYYFLSCNSFHHPEDDELALADLFTKAGHVALHASRNLFIARKNYIAASEILKKVYGSKGDPNNIKIAMASMHIGDVNQAASLQDAAPAYSSSLADTWESVADRLAVMRQQETTSYLYRNYLPESSEELNVSWRKYICDWSYKVVDHFDIPRDVVAVSLDLFDRYLATKGNKCSNKKAALLVAVATLQLAIKLHDSKKEMITTLANLSQGQFGPSHIEDMEVKVLIALGGKLHPPTPCAFLFQMLLFLPRPSVRQEIFEMSRYMTEVAVYDSWFVDCNNSTVAFAAILNVMDDIRDSRLSADIRDKFIRELCQKADLSNRSTAVLAARDRLRATFEVHRVEASPPSVLEKPLKNESSLGKSETLGEKSS